MQQILFYDTENKVYHGGVRLDDGDIVCACCGGLIPKDEQNEDNGFKLIKEYDNWIDFSYGIVDEDDIPEGGQL